MFVGDSVRIRSSTSIHSLTVVVVTLYKLALAVGAAGGSLRLLLSHAQWRSL
jgi:hypothetical protein